MGFVETLWAELAAAAAETLSPNVSLLQLVDVERFAEQSRLAMTADPEMRLPPPGGVLFVAHHRGGGRHAREANGDGAASLVAANRSVLTLAESAGIDAGICFFTSAYPGLRLTSAGTAEIREADAYDAFAKAFLVRQCNLLAPALVVVLGKPAARTLARWFAVERWSGPWTFQTLCATGACVTAVSIEGLDATGVVIPHPAFSSARFYLYGGVSGGRQAVVTALGDAWRLSRAKAARADAGRATPG